MSKSSKTLPTWFKSVVVLFSICLVIGIILPILNDVLYVSPQERTMRAIEKIYEEKKDFETILDADVNKNQKLDYDFATINKVYKIDNDLLIQSTGKKGYKNGDVTVWVKIVYDNGQAEIGMVLQESFTKQTLMSKLDSNFYGKFGNTLIDITEDYEKGYFTSDSKASIGNKNPVSGATYSANAVCNAVNGVIKYLNEDYRG